MKSVRRNVFETNSSSTHSLTMCSEEDYDKWEEGQLYFNNNREFLTRDQVIEELKKYRSVDIDAISNLPQDQFDEYVSEWEFYTYSKYEEQYEQFEHFCQSYEHSDGSKIIAFGYFGYDS